MDSNINRGLVLGGGGQLGYLQVKWLKKFVSTFNITIPLWQLFGVIAGTSVGAINGVSIAYQKSLDDLEKLFSEKGKRIFTSRTLLERAPPASHNASTDSLKLTDTQKIGSIIADEALYGSPYSDSNYGHNILHNALVESFGDDTLEALKTNVLVPAYNYTKDTFVKFSNYAHLEYFAPSAKIIDVLRATSAAPIYFPPYLLYGDLYEDGGIHLNLPIEQCLTCLKIIKKTARKIRLLVLTTGASKELIQAQSAITPDMSDIEKKEVNAEHAISKILRLYTTSAAGAQAEAIRNLKLLCKYTLDDIAYYCFYPLFDTPLTFSIGEGSNKIEYVDYKPTSVTMDNSDPVFLAYLDALVAKDFLDNANEISTFASKLLE